MRPCIVVEQNDPTCELVCSFRFDRLANGGQGLRVTQDILCCPALQEVLSEWAVLVKQERQHNLSCNCVDGLRFFGGGYPGCFFCRLCRLDSGSMSWHQDSSSEMSSFGTYFNKNFEFKYSTMFHILLILSPLFTVSLSLKWRNLKIRKSLLNGIVLL